MLLDSLPKEVHPQIFPPINVPPEEIVSTAILETIKRCETLVYIKGSFSAESGWVTLERDYALRNGLDVYSFDPQTRRIRYDLSSPAVLPAFAIYSRKDKDIVLDIIKFMSEERSFDMFSDWHLPIDTPPRKLRKSLNSHLKKGGYLTLFWSSKASHSRGVKLAVEDMIKSYEDRVVIALLEPTELPDGLKDVVPVELYRGDGSGIDKRNVDTLIVRLYWFIVPDTLVQNYAPSVQDFQLLHTSRRARSPSR